MHASLYAVLAALCIRAARPFDGFAGPALLLGAVLAFAGADEWHQQYIAGRAADPMDWAADAAGATAAILFLTRARTRRETES